MNEILVYSGVVMSGSIQQASIESYLACKYGITLDQTVAQNYLFSGGTAMWTNAENPGYLTDIGCIARDNGYSLVQTKSQASNNVNDIIIEAT